MWLISTIGHRQHVIQLLCLESFETTLMTMTKFVCVSEEANGCRTSFRHYEYMMLLFFTCSHYRKGLHFSTALGHIWNKGVLKSWLKINFSGPWGPGARLSLGAVWCFTGTRFPCMPNTLTLFFCSKSTWLKNVHLFSIMTQNSMLFENLRGLFCCLYNIHSFPIGYVGSKWIF